MDPEEMDDEEMDPEEMDAEEMDAEAKFWEIPELKEKLLLYLDPYSTLCLVQSQVCSV